MTDDEADGEADVQEPGADGTVASPDDPEFGARGWLLVAGVLVALVIVPLVIYLTAGGIVSLPFRFSFLVLPLLPAVLLALLAVWVTTTA